MSSVPPYHLSSSPSAARRGWLFDLYARDGVMVLWFLDEEGGAWRAEDGFTPRFYLDGPEATLAACARALHQHGDAEPEGWVERLDIWSGAPRRVFAMRVLQPGRWLHCLPNHARQFPTVGWYNADLQPEQVYCHERGVFPLARCTFAVDDAGRLAGLELHDSRWSTDYDLPPMREVRLRGEGQLHGRPRLDRLLMEHEGRTHVWDEPAWMLEGLQSTLDRIDPDVIHTEDGDGFLMPLLLTMARHAGFPLRLDRDPPPRARPVATEGRSYFSYGRILYQQPDHILHGRWHLDDSTSFMLTETQSHGLFEVARLSGLPVQRIGRRSIGTGITSVQLAMAHEKGVLVPWKKTQPEAWKSAAQLLRTDRGGLVYAPVIGFHEQVVELDFASMYPSIMTNYNVSPETVNCRCCHNEAVPDIGYTICERRRGLVSEALEPLIAKRMHYKKLRRLAPPASEEYQRLHGRQDAIKWMLVCCFGYLGYRNARFGRIEAHEAVSAFSRELLVRAHEICTTAGWEMLHANVDCVWIRKPGFARSEIDELIARINAATRLTIALEGVYKWVAFLPSRQDPNRPVPTRYFGAFDDGTVKFRGIECRRRDYPRFAREAQHAMLMHLSGAGSLEEYRARIPAVLEMVAGFEGMLRRHEVPLEDLALRTVLSRNPDEYRGNGASAVAARQSERAGLKLHAGQSIRYILTRPGDRDLDRRVRLLDLADHESTADPVAYIRLLRRAANALLQPAGTQLSEDADDIAGTPRRRRQPTPAPPKPQGAHQQDFMEDGWEV